MKTNIQNNKFLTLLFILLSFAIVLFVTKDQFYKYSEVLDKSEQLNSELEAENTELVKLATLEKELTNGTKAKEIQGFSNDFSEDLILKYLYSYASQPDSGVKIKSINLTEEKVKELGFREANITLEASIDSKENLKKLLSYLTSRESQYTFFINTFNFDYNSTFDSTYDVSIPLKLLYK